MEFQFHFHHIDFSRSLAEYAEEHLTKAARFLMKEGRCSVEFAKLKHECSIEVTVQNPWGHFKATSRGEDFYQVVDEVASKLEKQILKKKSRIQHHKNPDAHYRKAS